MSKYHRVQVVSNETAVGKDDNSDDILGNVPSSSDNLIPDFRRHFNTTLLHGARNHVAALL